MEKIKKIKDGSLKVSRFIASRAFYLVLGIFLATAAVSIAAWDNTADRAGGGQLTGPMWDGLINNLKNNSGPSNWTCQWKDGTQAQNSVADCGSLGAGYKLITGGCAISAPSTSVNITAFNPAGSATQGGWSCWAPSTYQVIARAWCCK